MTDLKVEGKQFSFDDLTLGEMEQIEDSFNKEWQEMSALKQTIGAIWQFMLRTNPEATLEDARKQNGTSIFDTDTSPPS